MAQDDFLQFQERIKQAESGGRRYDKSGKLLTSPKGAQGEMQVMPGTQRSPGFGVEPAKGRSPDEIARVGSEYLAAMEKKYGDQTLAAIAYNMGPGATDKWLAAGADFSKLPKETQGYVQKVMGSAPATTKTAPAPNDSQQMMEDALKSGMSAKAEDLGSGYKAALALSFLGAEDADTPESEGDMQARLDREEEDTAAADLAAYKPYNALKDLQLSATSHIKPMQFADGGDVAGPGLIGENLPFNSNPMAGTGAIMMSHGGAVHRADGSPQMGEMVGDEAKMDALMQTGEKGAGYVNQRPPTRSAQELQAYMSAMNPGIRVNEKPMEPGLLGYVDPMPILEVPGLPNVLHINTNQSPGTAETTKLHELEHTLDLRGGDIKGREKVRYTDNNMRAYYLMGRDWRPIEQTVENFVNNKDKLEQFFGRPIESGYFREKSLQNLKEGGEHKALFKEQLATLSALEQATGKSLTRDPAMRELFPNTQMMAVFDALTGPRQTRMDARDLPPHTPQPSYTYETNPLMRFLKEKLGPSQEYGIPVKRAGGSPETGELGPYIGNPQIAKQGAAARQLAAQRNVNTLPDPKTYAAVAGFLGVPPDEQGFSVLHPDAAGIKKAGEAGFYGGIGAQLAPVVAPAAKALGKMAGSALNDRMLAGQSLTPGFNTPAPINFAVRPEQGGFFLHNQRFNMDEPDQFLRHFAGVQKGSTDPLDQWIYKRYSSYMRGPMGTEADPFVKGADAGRHFHFMDQDRAVFQPAYVDSVPYVRQTQGLPPGGFAKTSAGQNVETAIDASISPIQVQDVGDMNLSPKMRELAQKDPAAPVYEIMMEEMDSVLKPEELRTTLRTMMTDSTVPDKYRITPDQLQKMTLLDASEKAGQFERYMTEKEGVALMREAKNVPVYKSYDDGHRWMAPADVAQDEASKRYVLSTGKNARWCTEKEQTCLAYSSGDNHLLILANTNDGKPLVQVNYDTIVPEVEDWLSTMPWSQRKELVSKHMIHQMENLPEFKQWQRANTQEHIQEIKGRFNDTDLEGEALRKTQDLIRSKNWDKVNDIANAKLHDTQDMYPNDVVENYIKPNFGTRFLTTEELEQLPKPTNFAKGGMVERHINDNRKYL